MKQTTKKTLQIKKDILHENTSLADRLRDVLDEHHVFGTNFMASPGAGKTSVILKTIIELPALKIAVIEGDIVDIDVEKVAQTGSQVVLANTGGDCHLDAVMVDKALQNLNLAGVQLLIIENVGNLVCPAGFALGTHKNVVIASVPEGDDKPYKYPGMYKGADVVILNKVDYLAYQPFDLNYFSRGVMQVNPEVKIFPLSCRTGEGFAEWTTWLESQIKDM